MVVHGFLLPTRGAVLSSTDTSELAARIQSQVLGLARRAESQGFHSVWVGDSVLAKPRPEPLSTLAAIAGQTESIRLGTGIYIPTLRDPAHVAHMTATVDQLSGGRLLLGMGVGRGQAVKNEYVQLNLDFTSRGRLLDEILDTVTAFWSGMPIEYEGSFIELSDASIGFSPLRPPPIYLPYRSKDGQTEFPEYIIERFVKYADGWIPNRVTASHYERELSYIQNILNDHGRDPGSMEPALYHNVVIADSEREAIDRARSFLTEYYPRYSNLSDEDIKKQGAFGPPAVIKSHLRRFEDAGVEHFVTRFTSTEQHEQLDRFASIVL